MTIDVVVVAWRSAPVIEACLRCLEAQTAEHRTILVDNDSRDGTVQLVRERFPGVEVIALERNVGFGRAVGEGVRAGDGDAIVLVNPDVQAEPGFLEAITAPLRSEEVGMVAGLTTVPGTEVVDGFGIELDRSLEAYNRLRLRRTGEGSNQPGAPRAGEELGRLAGPSGGAAAYRRTAFESVGGFDPVLFAYGEDVDLALRLRAAGWSAEAAAGARGEHLGGASVGVDSPRQRQLAAFARGYILRRYGVLRSRAAAHALILDAAVVLWGLLRHRTAVPLTWRRRGWRAAAGERREIPPGIVDDSIGIVEAIRRHARAR